MKVRINSPSYKDSLQWFVSRSKYFYKILVAVELVEAESYRNIEKTVNAKPSQNISSNSSSIER